MARKQKTFDGMEDVNGKLIDTTSVIVMVPKTIEGVEIRKLDNGNYRAIAGEHQIDGETIGLALRGIAKLLK